MIEGQWCGELAGCKQREIFCIVERCIIAARVAAPTEVVRRWPGTADSLPEFTDDQMRAVLGINRGAKARHFLHRRARARY